MYFNSLAMGEEAQIDSDWDSQHLAFFPRGKTVDKQAARPETVVTCLRTQHASLHTLLQLVFPFALYPGVPAHRYSCLSVIFIPRK